MSRLARLLLLFGVLALSAGEAVGQPSIAPGEPDQAPAEVVVLIESPAPGTVVMEQVHQARVSGSAATALEGLQSFDVMLAIDVSESTEAASGTDIDRDGVIGVNPRDELLPPGAFPAGVFSTDPQDTVLHAEITAARALVESLDSRRVRVGVLSFAGEVDPRTGMRKRIDQRDAWLEVPLTHDYGRVQRGLTAVLARGTNGATNYAAGLRLAIAELAGIGSVSQPRPAARKVVLFLTDGMPTLPVGKGNTSDPGDLEAAVQAAQVAARAGISVNTYALGTKALEYPVALTEMSRATRGNYTPVQSPGDIVALLQGVSFSDVEDVVFTNLTTGELSTDVKLGPDGSFYGYVPVAEGTNQVRVSALASDGSTGIAEFEMEFRVGGQTDQEKLIELKQLQRMNRELQLRTERDRIRSFRDDQRKELDLRAINKSN